MKGWYNKSYEHSLASKGVRTKNDNNIDKIKYKMYHGTDLESYKQIISDSEIVMPYITNDYIDANDWSKKATINSLPVILELEIPRNFIETSCAIDPLLLDERYLGNYGKYDDMVNELGSEASYWWMDELKKRDIDWIHWTLENVNAFECNINIPKEWIKKVYIMKDFNKQLNHGHWEELN